MRYTILKTLLNLLLWSRFFALTTAKRIHEYVDAMCLVLRLNASDVVRRLVSLNHISVKKSDNEFIQNDSSIEVCSRQPTLYPRVFLYLFVQLTS